MFFARNPNSGKASKSRGDTKKIAVIGAGISGIIAAAVLQEDGHDVVILERRKQVGGVWRYDCPPGVRLQNLSTHYRHPDLDWQFEPDEHPTREQIVDYMEYCIEKFKLQVHYETTVEQMHHLDDEPGWRILVKEKGGRTDSLDCDFCVIAQGHYSKIINSQDDYSSFLRWEGMDDFRRAGGEICTRHGMEKDVFEDIEGKTVAVVGFGKTALDICHLASRRNPEAVYHVFRYPRWLVPESVFGFHWTWLLFTRLNQSMLPAWDQPFDPLRMIHEKYPRIFVWFWKCVQWVIWCQHFVVACMTAIRWKNRTILQQLQQLKPENPFLMEQRFSTVLCPKDYFPLVAKGTIVPTKGGIRRFTSEGLEMRDGTVIEADKVFVCVGNAGVAAEFPYLPEECRGVLEDDKRGAQLYRHMLHPQIPDLAFAGWNQGFMHCSHVYLGAIWLSCMLRGEMVMPPMEKQLSCMEWMARWKKQNTLPESVLNCSVNTRMLHYNDVLMSDLGCDPYRKANIMLEIFARYGLEDYSGTLKEVKKRRRDARKEGYTLVMNPIGVNM